MTLSSAHRPAVGCGSRPGPGLGLLHLCLGLCFQPTDFFLHRSSRVSGLNAENGSQVLFEDTDFLTQPPRYAYPDPSFEMVQAALSLASSQEVLRLCLASSLARHLHPKTLPHGIHPYSRPLPLPTPTPIYPECATGERHFLELSVPRYFQASAMDSFRFCQFERSWQN